MTRILLVQTSPGPILRKYRWTKPTFVKWTWITSGIGTRSSRLERPTSLASKMLLSRSFRRMVSGELSQLPHDFGLIWNSRQCRNQGVVLVAFNSRVLVIG